MVQTQVPSFTSRLNGDQEILILERGQQRSKNRRHDMTMTLVHHIHIHTHIHIPEQGDLQRRSLVLAVWLAPGLEPGNYWQRNAMRNKRRRAKCDPTITLAGGEMPCQVFIYVFTLPKVVCPRYSNTSFCTYFGA